MHLVGGVTVFFIVIRGGGLGGSRSCCVMAWVVVCVYCVWCVRVIVREGVRVVLRTRENLFSA